MEVAKVQSRGLPFKWTHLPEIIYWTFEVFPGDDENWMKHTLSWLDKPYVEDAKAGKGILLKLVTKD